MIKFQFVCALLAGGLACAAQTPEYGYQIIHVYPHDPDAFTQGLEFRAGFLYESTGLKGHSSVRRERLETGKVLQQIDLDPQFFGEGITVLNRKIFELTWKAQTGFVYDQASFRRLRSFNYPGEGWGLANDGRNIYMSDGSDQIRVWDPVTLQEKRRITVQDHGQSIPMLNELEWVRGEIYANVWQTDRIARISPTDGRVVGWIDLAGILSAADRTGSEDVLNGIAYDVLGNRLFVTGKLWPKLFQIKLIPKSQRRNR
ncbi:MAG TPA: glutaminyl-peptide cyclotransferase [Bryobacteraceae bacterium]|nr:glutaminyl-peptide cyclotransferase [Bryobacteraceae bacterium]